MKKIIYSSSISLILLVALSMSTHATLLGDGLIGSTVVYNQVEESIIGTDTSGTYGEPIVSGDTLDFNPDGLGILSSGDGIGFKDAQLNFLVQAKEGHYISDLQFSEAGDYVLGGTGTSDTYAKVEATFFINIYEVDGNPIPTENGSEITTFGTFSLPADAGAGLWSGDINLDIESILVDNGVPFVNGATFISVVLDNLMTAESEDGTFASLKKKDATGFAVTAIPEPSSMLLIGVASSLIVFVRSRFIG